MGSSPAGGSSSSSMVPSRFSLFGTREPVAPCVPIPVPLPLPNSNPTPQPRSAPLPEPRSAPMPEHGAGPGSPSQESGSASGSDESHTLTQVSEWWQTQSSNREDESSPYPSPKHPSPKTQVPSPKPKPRRTTAVPKHCADYHYRYTQSQSKVRDCSYAHDGIKHKYSEPELICHTPASSVCSYPIRHTSLCGVLRLVLVWFLLLFGCPKASLSPLASLQCLLCARWLSLPRLEINRGDTITSLCRAMKLPGLCQDNMGGPSELG